MSARRNPCRPSVVPGEACAELAAFEPLRGTAPKSTPTWILLEYAGPWESDAVAESSLPESVKQRLSLWPEQVPGCRVALIRQPGREPTTPACFVAHTGAGEPWLLSLSLSGYDDLLDIDLAEVLASGTHPRGELRQAPLHLVCTHGRRDVCCAVRGVAVYEAMAAVSPLEVWHASHVGGHRFAANVVSLPEAVCYGRVEAAEATALLEAHRRGEIYALERLRGRSSEPRAVQAAESFLREELGLLRIAGVEALTVTVAGDVHEVLFRVATEEHVVRVEAETLQPRPPSCGEPPTPAVAWRRAP